MQVQVQVLVSTSQAEGLTLEQEKEVEEEERGRDFSSLTDRVARLEGLARWVAPASPPATVHQGRGGEDLPPTDEGGAQVRSCTCLLGTCTCTRCTSAPAHLAPPPAPAHLAPPPAPAHLAPAPAGSPGTTS